MPQRTPPSTTIKKKIIKLGILQLSLYKGKHPALGLFSNLCQGDSPYQETLLGTLEHIVKSCQQHILATYLTTVGTSRLTVGWDASVGIIAQGYWIPLLSAIFTLFSFFTSYQPMP
jgi:hypothetical protein